MRSYSRTTASLMRSSIAATARAAQSFGCMVMILLAGLVARLWPLVAPRGRGPFSFSAYSVGGYVNCCTPSVVGVYGHPRRNDMDPFSFVVGVIVGVTFGAGCMFLVLIRLP